MRYVFGFLCVCTLVATSPQSVSAQAGEEDVPKVPVAIHTQHRLPPQLMLRASYYYVGADADTDATSDQTEPKAEEPALQLKLDSAGIEVVPSPLRTADGYTLEETELRVRRAKIGLGVSAGVLFLGTVMMAAGFASYDAFCFPEEEHCGGLGAAWAGVAFMVGGSVGMTASGTVLSKWKRKLRSSEPPSPDKQPPAPKRSSRPWERRPGR